MENSVQPTEFAGGVGGETQQSQVAGREVALYHHWASLSHSNSWTRVSVPESNLFRQISLLKMHKQKKQKDQKTRICMQFMQLMCFILHQILIFKKEDWEMGLSIKES